MFWRCIWLPKIKFLGLGIETLESEQDRLIWLLNVTAPKAPAVSEEVETVNQDSGTDVADLVAVSPDGSEIDNATEVVSETDWMPIKTDERGRPFSVLVKPLKQCSHWKFSRVFFEIKGAYKFRIRVGDVYIVDWVRIIGKQGLCNIFWCSLLYSK